MIRAPGGRSAVDGAGPADMALTTRVRMRFTKLGKLRWTGHRDVARMWERALRRVGLPVAYSAGFTPRPKVSFGLALPTGHESLAEYLDVLVASDRDLDSFVAADRGLGGLASRLSNALPVGMDVTAIAVVERDGPSLQESVSSCGWELEAVGAEPDDVSRLVERALAADALVIRRERKGATVVDDVRSAVLAASVIGPPACAALGFVDHLPGATLTAELATRTRSLRPAEFLAACSLGLPTDRALREGHVRRTHQWILRDGARREILPLAATDAPHAEACVMRRDLSHGRADEWALGRGCQSPPGTLTSDGRSA